MRALAALACAALLGCNIEADFSDHLKTEILPAERYQQKIVSIDRLVFREEPLGDEGVQALDGELEDLAKSVAAVKPDSRFLKLESLELRHLASRARRLSPKGSGAALQNDWMRIRNNLFDDRAWFARSANDLDYAASVTTSTAAVVTAPPAETKKQEVAVEPGVFESRATLSGRWEVVGITANGTPRTDDEITGATWTFEPSRVIVRGGNGVVQEYSMVAGGQYLELKSPRENGWVKYEITGEGLYLAFFDGLRGKPSSFEASPGQDPLLIVVRLRAIP